VELKTAIYIQDYFAADNRFGFGELVEFFMSTPSNILFEHLFCFRITSVGVGGRRWSVPWNGEMVCCSFSVFRFLRKFRLEVLDQIR
jgi:hypothetical protein